MARELKSEPKISVSSRLFGPLDVCADTVNGRTRVVVPGDVLSMEIFTMQEEDRFEVYVIYNYKNEFEPGLINPRS